MKFKFFKFSSSPTPMSTILTLVSFKNFQFCLHSNRPGCIVGFLKYFFVITNETTLTRLRDRTITKLSLYRWPTRLENNIITNNLVRSVVYSWIKPENLSCRLSRILFYAKRVFISDKYSEFEFEFEFVFKYFTK